MSGGLCIIVLLSRGSGLSVILRGLTIPRPGGGGGGKCPR